jgi:carboxypeptidase C (cathepsin A)
MSVAMKYCKALFVLLNLFSCIFIVFFLMANAVSASEREKSSIQETKKEPADDKTEKSSKTEHHIKINEEDLRYTATAGELVVEYEQDQEKKEKIKGRVFYVAYELKGVKKPERPVTFVFNGGPGAASVWLHLGGLGPKRIILDQGKAPPPPVRYKNNPFTWLSFTDLVFVDPVGTGFSRGMPDDEQSRKVFYSFQQDIKSVAEFIRLYLTRYNRWMSPKFLVGESYGTTRVAGLARYMQKRFGVDLNGVVLISPVLDYDTIVFSPSNDLPYGLFLPTYASIALYHNVLSKGGDHEHLATLLKNVEDFTLNKYIAYLAKGEDLSVEQGKELQESLFRYTGISKDIIQRNHFRINRITFAKNLLRDKGQIIGKMDGTITGIDPDPAHLTLRYDPSLDTLFGPFSGAMNSYVREELKFESDLFYEFLNYEVSAQWDWGSELTGKQGFIDVSHTLREAIAVNKSLNVFIASGYYDLVTPYFTARHTVNHMWLGKDRSNIRMKIYKAGHMIYTHTEELRKLTDDVKEFYKSSYEK